MFRIDTANKKLIKLEDTTFADINIKERYDIQEWIASNPEVLGQVIYNNEDSLLIIAKEHAFDGKVAGRGIRSDLIAMDKDGKVVIIELKRDNSGCDVDWQAIKYAARISKYSTERIAELLLDYEKINSIDDAKQKIIEHVSGISSGNNNFDEVFQKIGDGLCVRIILVAKDFNPDVCAAVLWMRETSNYAIDISCVKLKPFKDGDSLFLDSELIIPLPETRSYTDHRSKNYTRIDKLTYDYNSQSRYSDDLPVPPLSKEQLEIKLRETFSINSDQIPRLKAFLRILCDRSEPITQDEMKRELAKMLNISEGRAGTYLSNISTFITSKKSGFLRQMIEYGIVGGGEPGPGAKKTDYKIRTDENKDYRTIIKNVLDETKCTTHQ